MNNKKDGIPFDGFGSVLEMLRHADAPFREKLLQNVRRRDPHLARRLESELQEWFSRNGDSRGALERSTRSAQARNYGN